MNAKKVVSFGVLVIAQEFVPMEEKGIRQFLVYEKKTPTSGICKGFVQCSEFHWKNQIEYQGTTHDFEAQTTVLVEMNAPVVDLPSGVVARRMFREMIACCVYGRHLREEVISKLREIIEMEEARESE